jgi:hypothetical protein
MSISTEFDTLWATKSAVDRLITSKVALQNAYNVLMETNSAVQAVVDVWAFTGVPADILTALNTAWQAVKTAKAAMSATNVQEALNWAGK